MRSRDAAMGMQNHLFYYPLRRAPLQRTSERRCLESGVRNAGPAEQVEYALRHDGA